jgi:perosamine synthetase
VFVDIEPDTANMNPDLIEDAISRRTKAVLPVDAFGQPARLDAVREIADPPRPRGGRGFLRIPGVRV